VEGTPSRGESPRGFVRGSGERRDYVFRMKFGDGNPSGRVIRRSAPAKINLALSVGGPEPIGAAKPGYHRIASWMACLDLHDDLTIERLTPSSASEYSIEWALDAPRPTPIDWPIEKDLAVRAHRGIEKRIGASLPVRMSLIKRIPTGAGLGGGSSDAAAMMLALDELFSLRLGEADLHEEAMNLGSDVAFFIDRPAEREDRGQASSRASDLAGVPPRPALVTGFGETIERVPRIPARTLLAIPAFGSPTAGVYKAYDELLAGSMSTPRGVSTGSRPAREPAEGLVRLLIRRSVERGWIDPADCFNALTSPAMHLEPRIGEVIEAVTRASGVPAHLTGSGSCVFAIAAGDGAVTTDATPRTIDGLADRSLTSLPILAALVSTRLT
jgi:4-diphosphocytidyl-2-C-methyl-D-erythritol kinase